jgi:hypothetical protein
MANSLTVKVIEDGPRNAIVNLVGFLDSANMVEPAAVALSMFNTQDRRGTFYGLKVMEAEYSVTEDLVVQLDWNANTPQNIAALSGSAEICWADRGGISPDRTAGGYDGSINLTTKGFLGGKPYGFTIQLVMVKKYS